MAYQGDSDAAAAELLAEVEAELLEQQTEEATNIFVSVKELRSWVKTESPEQTVFLSVIMCLLAWERLPNNRGTRLTLVDGFMQPHIKAYGVKLGRMDDFRRDARVFKLTVWDPKNRSLGRPHFQSGVVYELKKVHCMKFYHEVLQGCLQATGALCPGVIEEVAEFEAAKRARLLNDVAVDGAADRRSDVAADGAAGRRSDAGEEEKDEFM